MSASDPSVQPDVDTIRRLQQFTTLCSLLPRDGKLREVIERALALPGEPVRSRTRPIEDRHPHTAKAWFESIWLGDGLSDEEKNLVDWQRNSTNMAAAIRELRDVERRTGITLVAVSGR